jgi:hypothetical protein
VPISFWDDRDGKNFTPCHGDYVEVTQHDGIIVYGGSGVTDLLETRS